MYCIYILHTRTSSVLSKCLEVEACCCLFIVLFVVVVYACAATFLTTWNAAITELSWSFSLVPADNRYLQTDDTQLSADNT